MRKAAWGWLGLAAVVIGLDQLTKLYVDTHLTYGQTLPVFRGLNWVLAYNPGAAFSFLADAGGWQRFFFAALALGVSAWLGWLIVRGRESTAMNLAAACIMGGALGNVIDRFAYGHVIDFIQVYYANHYWPAFNLADSASCFGAACMVWDSFQQSRRAAH